MRCELLACMAWPAVAAAPVLARESARRAAHRHGAPPAAGTAAPTRHRPTSR